MNTTETREEKGTAGPPYDPRAVANFILDCNSALTRPAPLGVTKLLKVIYFTHGFHFTANQYSLPLVNADFEAWEHGPVIPCVYECFKKSGEGTIKRRRATKINFETREHQIVDYRDFTPDTEKFFADFLPFLLKYSATALSDKSHAEGSPWHTVYTSTEVSLDGITIPHDSIKKYFAKNFWVRA